MRGKRRITILLLGTLLLGLCACGLQKTSEPETPPEAAAETAPEESAAEEAAVEVPEETPEPQLPAEEEPVETEPPLPAPPDIDISSWEYRLANSFNSIGEYQPPYSALEGQGIDERAEGPAREFLEAARAAGFHAWCSVIYRNYEYQEGAYKSFVYNVAQDPVDAANRMLGPGLDDHQTGLSLDFTDDMGFSASYSRFEDDYMKDTDLYRWLVDHCTEYGFILRYPEGKEAFYGVACNHPAHFRYVGKEAAEYITENNLCLEEFLLLYEGNDVYLPKTDG